MYGCCGEKQFVHVAAAKRITGTAEVLLDYAATNSVAFHRHGGGPCRCFEVERWYEGGITPSGNLSLELSHE